MSKPVRLSEEVYSRLGNLSEGFETPSETILRVLNNYEFLESYNLLSKPILSKLEIFKDELAVKIQEVNVLLHFNQESVKKAIEKIIEENDRYNFSYKQNINSISVTIERN